MILRPIPRIAPKWALLFTSVVVLATGCSSGVSQEDHDAVVAEGEQLKTQLEESAAEVTRLSADKEAAESRATNLETELGSTSEALAEAEDLLAATLEEPEFVLPTLLTVLIRGHLRCGIGGSHVGFSETLPDGDVVGFDADFCRAVAAAVLGDSDAVEFVPVTAAERFSAVEFGFVDVLFRTSTWTLRRDAMLRMDFGPTTFYDGQQLMGRRDFPLNEGSTVADIDGAVVCANPDTSQGSNIAERAAEAGISINSEAANFAEAVEKLQQGVCDVITTDGSTLLGQKSINDPDDEWVIFPQTALSREPLGPVYRSDDSLWADIVNWVVFATIIAESKGISSTNLQVPSGDSEAARLLGTEETLATDLGLDADAFREVIRQVGNYAEIYERNLAPLGVIREGTFNELAENGGLLYAPPVR